jgi:hypothetical protein
VSGPKRIQLRRTKGWRKPAGAIVVARPSRWGNPYKVGDLVLDPVNSVNPIASVVHHDSWAALVGTTLTRDTVHGDTYTSEVRRIAESFEAVQLYRRRLEHEGYDLSPLAGHDLCCWCSLSSPCHADVLLELANR